MAVKVLFVAANPQATDRLMLGEEIQSINQHVRLAKYRDNIQIISEWAVNVGGLIQLLNQHEPDILHFSSHGSALGDIVLQDHNGRPQMVSPQAMEELVKSAKTNLRLVVFNACNSQLQAEATTKYINCAVGLPATVDDLRAVEFSGTFYGAIANGLSVGKSFSQAKVVIQSPANAENNLPLLKCRRNINPNKEIFVRKSNWVKVCLVVAAIVFVIVVCGCPSLYLLTKLTSGAILSTNPPSSFSESPSFSSPSGTISPMPTDTNNQVFQINARTAYGDSFETGMYVNAGDKIQIKYISGQWWIGQSLNNNWVAQSPTDANGYVGRDDARVTEALHMENPNKCRPLLTAPFGSLVGHIGKDGAIFFIGDSIEFTAEDSGILYARINYYNHNAVTNCPYGQDGSIAVRVKIQPR